jgi:hypothetical protein
LLLAVHLFNLIGYSLLFEYFMQRSDEHLTQQFDKHQYNDNELIEVKIALHTPYITNWSDYERIDGETQVNGVFYSYVKRKIHNDTLYLLCIPNKNKTQLNSERIEYAGKVNGIPTNAKDIGLFKKNPAGSEYPQPVAQFTVSLLSAKTVEIGERPALRVMLPYMNVPFHPPQG